jgi:hypothetical protein
MTKFKECIEVFQSRKPVIGGALITKNLRIVWAPVSDIRDIIAIASVGTVNTAIVFT